MIDLPQFVFYFRRKTTKIKGVWATTKENFECRTTIVGQFSFQKEEDKSPPPPPTPLDHPLVQNYPYYIITVPIRARWKGLSATMGIFLYL